MHNPFRYFNSSPEVIRLAVMMYIRYPLSLRQVEDLLFERGIDICHETVRFWWNRLALPHKAQRLAAWMVRNQDQAATLALCQTSNDAARSSLYMDRLRRWSLVAEGVVGRGVDVEEALRRTR